MYLERLIRQAEALLQAGYPLPVDLLTALAAEGVDLSTFDH